MLGPCRVTARRHGRDPRLTISGPCTASQLRQFAQKRLTTTVEEDSSNREFFEEVSGVQGGQGESHLPGRGDGHASHDASTICQADMHPTIRFRSGTVRSERWRSRSSSNRSSSCSG